MTKVGVRVLVIDDEPSICKFLRASLEANRFQMIAAVTGNEGLQKISNERPDIIILDLGLPDLNGFEVLKRMREWSKTPVIVLTAQDADEDKVQALDSGADDYLTKPFSVAELLARIRVALRHAHPEEASPVFKAGPLEIDRAARKVKIAAQEIKLTVTEYDILRVLAQYAGRVVTHRVLLKEVWGPNSIEHTQYLRVYLGQIRKKLQISEAIPELIATESGVGYRLLLHKE